MIWTHGDVRLSNGPVPGGRRASSVDFCAILGECRAPLALSTNKSAAAKTFPGIHEIPGIRGQILKTPIVIKPLNQSKPALSLT